MSTSKAAASGGISFSTLAGLAGAVISFVTQPVFIGWAGVGMAALVGAGTFIGAAVVGTVGAVAGIVAGGSVLGLIGLVGGRKTGGVAIVAGAISGAIVGTAGGAIYGAFKGYELSESALVAKTCQAPFNDAVAKLCFTTNTYTPSLRVMAQPNS